MIKEIDVVKYVIQNFNTYFPDFKFHKTEFSLRNFRVDILASFEADLKDLGLRDESFICRPALFIEVKHNSKMRDLMLELKKQLNFQKWYMNIAKAFCMIAVLSDEFDETMVDYMEENGIIMYRYSYENEDLSTLTIEEYNSSKYKLENPGDEKYYESEISKAN